MYDAASSASPPSAEQKQHEATVIIAFAIRIEFSAKHHREATHGVYEKLCRMTLGTQRNRR